MRIKRLIVLFALLTLSATPPLMAQVADTLVAAEVFSVKSLPVVKAAEEVFLPDMAAVPQQVAEVLTLFTGVQVKDYGGVGGLKTVNVRSLGSEHVGIFLDGIQIDNAQNMQVDLGRFSTEGLSRVSLFNGQKSRRLQTAKEYASGAAVHLDTAPPVRIGNGGGKAGIKGGSFATVNPYVSIDRTFGKVTAVASADFLSSSGKYKYPYFDTTLVRENGDIRSLRLETRLYARNDSGDWRLHLYSFGSERGFPGPVIRRASGFPFSAERQVDQDLFLQGGWNREWTERYSTSLRYKYANSYTHYDSHPEKNPMALPYNLHYRQQSAYISLAQSYVISSPWSVDMSADVQGNSLDSDVGQFVSPRRVTAIGVLASRLSFDSFRIAGHLVYQGTWDFYDEKNAGGWSRENTYRDAWMPSLSLYYSPCKWFEADGFVKKSYRLPSFNDLYYSMMGNSSLLPESAFQMGLDLRFKGGVTGRRWELRLSPYRNVVDNKIVAIPTSSQFRWTMLNIGRADITGIDSRVNSNFILGALTLDAALRYSFQQALDHSTPGSTTYGNQIPYIPLHSGSISLDALWQKWHFGWNITLTGVKWSRSANTDDYRIAPWSSSDGFLSRKIKPGFSDSAEIEAGVSLRNIFNSHYQIVQGYPMPGFNAMFMLSLSW